MNCVLYLLEVLISGFYSIASRGIGIKWENTLPRLYQGGQRYWNVFEYTGMLLVLLSVTEIWEIAKLYWDLLGKSYFN